MENTNFYVSNDSDNGETVIRNEDREIIARMVQGEGYNNETDESLYLAAKLFAASGNMLESMKNMVEWLGDEWENQKQVQEMVGLIQSIEPDWLPTYGVDIEENEEAF